MSGSSRSESQEEDSEEEYSSQSIASAENDRGLRKHNEKSRRRRGERNGDRQSGGGYDDGEVDMNGSHERDEEVEEDEKAVDDQYSEEEEEEEDEGDEDVGMATLLHSQHCFFNTIHFSFSFIAALPAYCLSQGTREHDYATGRRAPVDAIAQLSSARMTTMNPCGTVSIVRDSSDCFQIRLPVFGCVLCSGRS